VVEAIREAGIDISMNKPKMLTYQMSQGSDLIVKMGCSDQDICPGAFFKQTLIGTSRIQKESLSKKYEKSETTLNKGLRN